jgi:hypothetical protein
MILRSAHSRDAFLRRHPEELGALAPSLEGYRLRIIALLLPSPHRGEVKRDTARINNLVPATRSTSSPRVRGEGGERLFPRAG